jgi:DNA repair photolyase
MAKNSEAKALAMFPILPSSNYGIARLAAKAEAVDRGHAVEFRSLATRSVLNRSISRRKLSLAYSINPYRGCEFACRYCYARYTHEFLQPRHSKTSTGPPSIGTDEVGALQAPSPRQAQAAGSKDRCTIDAAPQPWATAFEHQIYLKMNAAWLLEQELRRIDPAEEIALGTATDPYQPIERRARITRSLLEVFARKRGYRLGIVTKSRLIERDIDLLQLIARHNTLVVHLTITTPDAELARLIEPRAPRPDLRLRAVRHLRGEGITTGILCSPLLPGITDTAAAIDSMACAAAEAHASFFAAQPLFLKSCSRPTYLSFVREHFPALVPLYEQHFATADFAQQPYRARMAALVGAACRRHGLAQRSSDALLTRDEGAGARPAVQNSGLPVQQQLFA